jgi:hypothetical protein
MNPLLRTQTRTELLRIYDAMDPAVAERFGDRSEIEELPELPTAPPPEEIVLPEIDPSERERLRAEQDAEIMCQQVLGEGQSEPSSTLASLRKIHQQVVGTQDKHIEAAADALAASILAKFVAHTVPPAVAPPKTSPSLARLAELATETDPDSPLTQFLDGFVTGNERIMRAAARRMREEQED